MAIGKICQSCIISAIYDLPLDETKHRAKRLYERGDRSGIRPDLLETVERILTVLDSAAAPQALDIPRYRLHPLKGELKGLVGCDGTS